MEKKFRVTYDKKGNRITLQDMLYKYFVGQKKVTIGKKELCKMFGVEQRTLYHAIKALESEKKIKVKRNYIDGIYTKNTYSV